MGAMKKNLYQILCVYPNATQQAIVDAHIALRTKYKGLSDKGDQTAADELVTIQAAYETLSDKDKREAYDDKLAAMQFKQVGDETPRRALGAPLRAARRDNKSKLIACIVCGNEISSSADSCPHCGERSKAAASVSPLAIVSVGLSIASVFMPYFAAVFLVPVAIICSVLTLRSGQRQLGRIGLGLGLLGLVGVIYTSSQITKLTSPFHRGEARLEQSMVGEQPTATRSKYDRVGDGMSYAEVVAIIGEQGEELSRSDAGGLTTVMYAWGNANGSNMTAMFQGDRLVNKAQFGLE